MKIRVPNVIVQFWSDFCHFPHLTKRKVKQWCILQLLVLLFPQVLDFPFLHGRSKHGTWKVPSFKQKPKVGTQHFLGAMCACRLGGVCSNFAALTIHTYIHTDIHTDRCVCVCVRIRRAWVPSMTICAQFSVALNEESPSLRGCDQTWNRLGCIAPVCFGCFGSAQEPLRRQSSSLPLCPRHDPRKLLQVFIKSRKGFIRLALQAG